MQRQGFTIPLLIGGATTSEMHTAVKIAPKYDQPVVYVPDASRAVGVAGSLLSTTLRAPFIEDVKKKYAAARERFASQVRRDMLSLEAARANAPKLDYAPVKPTFLGVKTIDMDFKTLRDYIDWTPFFHTWGMPMKYPRIFDDAEKGFEARKLFDDAQEMIEIFIKQMRPRGVLGFFAATRENEDIIIGDRRLVGLRQQVEGKTNASLADFVAPQGDYIGAFAVTAGEADLFKDDPYKSMLAKSVADRFAEAFAEALHEKVRKELWGYARDEKLAKENLIREEYKGIRPAPGYPACPDHTLKRDIWALLDVEKNAGIQLTESLAMWPASSVSGFYFAHPESRYFGITRINRDQLEDYARRKGITLAEAERWLAPLL